MLIPDDEKFTEMDATVSAFNIAKEDKRFEWSLKQRIIEACFQKGNCLNDDELENLSATLLKQKEDEHKKYVATVTVHCNHVNSRENKRKLRQTVASTLLCGLATVYGLGMFALVNNSSNSPSSSSSFNSANLKLDN